MLYQGGSRFAWTHTIKWRLNKNKEFEITRSTHDAQGKLTPTDGEPVEVTPGDMLIREVNYLAGRISVTVVGKDNKPKKKSCLIPKDYKPARFETFDYREFDDGSDSCSVEI